MEQFNVSCGADEVIVMDTAKYGRMKLGRCVRRNLGYVGCGLDVLPYMDRCGQGWTKGTGQGRVYHRKSLRVLPSENTGCARGGLIGEGWVFKPQTSQILPPRGSFLCGSSNSGSHPNKVMSS